MKKLMQHKSFIYRGDLLDRNLREIEKDLSELLNVEKSRIFNLEDVHMYDSKDLLVDCWEEVYRNFLFNPTKAFNIIIFNNADELSVIFQNKLLKVIEDADSRVKIIFNTTKKLLPTIASRSITVKVTSDGIYKFPRSKEELLRHFSTNEAEAKTFYNSIIGIYNAVKNKGSLLVESGLIKEKSASLPFMSSKLNEIAELVILFETEVLQISERSFVARRYLECESNETNLYLFLFEIEKIRGVYE
ncbi:MAG: hypothetical protein IBX70_14015 [Clostridia bacterium]|nr:hypothetical protein [Clostridia bacterium]